MENLEVIDLCSRALVKAGAHKIMSFEDGTTESEVASALYEVIKDAMLCCHPWKFALKRQCLEKISDHGSKLQYGYRLPENCLRVICVDDGDKDRNLPYTICDKMIYVDYDKAYFTLLFRIDEKNFPPFFNNALIAKLAAEFSIPLSDSASRWEKLKQSAESELKVARLINLSSAMEL